MMMPVLEAGKRSVRVDDSGFLLDSNDWTKEIAEALAKSSALYPLTEEHWRVIIYIRQYFKKYNSAPMLKAISKRTKLEERRLRTLFPRSCHECMCKIAGLPKGTG
jgi:TusE/DsrC/DsvC family sulfur relay protein